MLWGRAGPVNLGPGFVALAALVVLGASACTTSGGPRPAGDTARKPAGRAADVRLSGSGPIRAGAASRVITPDLSSPPSPRMAGFAQGRDATGVHDDLYARAIVLEVGETSIALVALDLIGFFHDDVVRIRQ